MDVRVECARRLFTVDEYMRMGEVGILGEDERVELIRGEILTMSPNGTHYRRSTRLTGRASVSPLAFADMAVRLPDIFGWNAPPA